MVDADPLGDVVDVAHDLRERRVGVVAAVLAQEATAKLTPTTPSDRPIASSCSSVRLRVEAQSACAFECVATSGACEVRATSQKPGLVQVRDVDQDPEAVAGADELAARPSVSPGPVSGEAGNRNGTPSPNAFGRDQTMPSERRPRSYQRLEVGEVGRERRRRPRGA